MFVISCKTDKKQCVWVGVCLLLLMGIGALLLCYNQPVRSTATTTTDSGVAYLNKMGYTATLTDTRDITLPQQWDNTLMSLNAVQQAVGMDITPYLGKTVTCRTYTIPDHPQGKATAHLYFYKDKIIAGHLTVNGQMSALKEVTHATTSG